MGEWKKEREMICVLKLNFCKDCKFLRPVQMLSDSLIQPSLPSFICSFLRSHILSLIYSFIHWPLPFSVPPSLPFIPCFGGSPGRCSSQWLPRNEEELGTCCPSQHPGCPELAPLPLSLHLAPRCPLTGALFPLCFPLCSRRGVGADGGLVGRPLPGALRREGARLT